MAQRYGRVTKSCVWGHGMYVPVQISEIKFTNYCWFGGVFRMPTCTLPRSRNLSHYYYQATNPIIIIL